MRRAEIEQLIPAECDYLLRMWARYMRRGGVGKGYANHSAGFSSGGINCFDDFEDSVDNATVNSVNTVMNDLHPRDYMTISNHYCGRVAQSRGRWLDEDTDALLRAIEDFRRRARGRGALL